MFGMLCSTVDTSQPHTVIVVRQAVNLPVPNLRLVPPGTYVTIGDTRPHIMRDYEQRRLAACGLFSIVFVDPTARPEATAQAAALEAELLAKQPPVALAEGQDTNTQATWVIHETPPVVKSVHADTHIEPGVILDDPKQVAQLPADHTLDAHEEDRSNPDQEPESAGAAEVGDAEEGSRQALA